MRLPTAGLVLAILALTGCGADDPEPTPIVCLQGPGAYLTALEGAPDQATLEGGVAIGDCLPAEQTTADLNTAGAAMIAAATKLNEAAQRRPSGDSTTELGYLLGSIEEAASTTGGIHTDLVRRVNSAARFSDEPEGLGAEFERTFGAAYAAARGQG